MSYGLIVYVSQRRNHCTVGRLCQETAQFAASVLAPVLPACDGPRCLRALKKPNSDEVCILLLSIFIETALIRDVSGRPRFLG
jgi:hypothetical protein